MPESVRLTARTPFRQTMGMMTTSSIRRSFIWMTREARFTGSPSAAPCIHTLIIHGVRPAYDVAAGPVIRFLGNLRGDKALQIRLGIGGAKGRRQHLEIGVGEYCLVTIF